jgi:hypothetical protein
MDKSTDKETPILTELVPVVETTALALPEQSFGSQSLAEAEMEFEDGCEHQRDIESGLQSDLLARDDACESAHSSPDELDRASSVSPPVRSPSPPFTPVFSFESFGEDDSDRHRGKHSKTPHYHVVHICKRRSQIRDTCFYLA